MSHNDRPLANLTHKNLSDGRSLPQNGIQTWLLVRAAPFLLNDAFVEMKNMDPTQFKQKKQDKYAPPSPESVEELLAVHLQVLQITASPTLSKADVEVLRAKIFQQNSLIQRVFPADTYSNKIHHKLHYPDFILDNGPTKTWWTPRFEAYHQEMKRKSYSSRNFVNLPKTVANHLSYTFSYNCSYPELDSQKNRHKFKKNSAVLINFLDNLPFFGIIKSIDSVHENIYVQECNTIGFREIFNGFEIQRTQKYAYLQIDQLKSNYPLDLWKSQASAAVKSAEYVCLKYLLY